MESEIKVNRKNDLTIFTFKGSLNFDEYMVINRKFYGDNPTKNVIFDISSGDLGDVTDEQIHEAATFFKDNFYKRPVGAKTAFVVLGFNDLGTVRSWQFWNIIKEVKLNSKIFHIYKDAIAWIGK
jgi:hypothetical protein